MKLVPAAQGFTTLLSLAAGTREVTLWTFKRDRFVSASLIDAATVRLTESGFAEADATYPAGSAEFRHTAKHALRREFPRSNRVYLTTHHG